MQYNPHNRVKSFTIGSVKLNCVYQTMFPKVSYVFQTGSPTVPCGSQTKSLKVLYLSSKWGSLTHPVLSRIGYSQLPYVRQKEPLTMLYGYQIMFLKVPYEFRIISPKFPYVTMCLSKLT